MFVLNDIIKLNKILSDYFDCDIYDMFLNGYCLDYYLFLKKLYPDSYMLIKKNTNHCVICINNIGYDVGGIVCDDNYYKAEDRDIDFVYSFYNRMDEKDFSNISNKLVGLSKIK